MKKRIWQKMLANAKRNRACHFVLLDPDKESPSVLCDRARLCEEAGVDAILVGGSFVKKLTFENSVRRIHQSVKIPVILFPGESGQVTRFADAILFTSLVSGRNADYLIGHQAKGAPLVKKYGLEAIPTAYMLIESGSVTSVERASKTKPMPANRPALAAEHALAARYLGMHAVYLEAGSGAKRPVPNNMTRAVKKSSGLFVIVGGGIRSPKTAMEKVRAGADAIVTGTVFEGKRDTSLLRRMVMAIKKGRLK